MHLAYLARLIALMSIASVVTVSASPAHILDTRGKASVAKQPSVEMVPAQGTAAQPSPAASAPKALSGVPLGLLGARKVADSAILGNAVPANLASDNLMNAAANAVGGSAGAAKRRVAAVPASPATPASSPKSVDATELTGLSRPASLAGSLLQSAPAAARRAGGLLSALASQQPTTATDGSSPANTSPLGLRDATNQVKQLDGQHASSVSPSALSQIIQVRDSQLKALGLLGGNQATQSANGQALSAAQPVSKLLRRSDAQLQIQGKRMAYVRSTKDAKSKHAHAHKNAAKKSDKSGAAKTTNKSKQNATMSNKAAPTGTASSSAAGKSADGSAAKAPVKGHKTHTNTKRTETKASTKSSPKKVKVAKKGAKSHTTA